MSWRLDTSDIIAISCHLPSNDHYSLPGTLAHTLTQPSPSTALISIPGNCCSGNEEMSVTMDWVLGQPSSFMVMVALICNIPRVLARSQQSLIESLWLWRSCDRLQPHRSNTSICLVHDIESCNKLITYDGRGHDMTQNNNISDKDNEENMRVTIIILLRLIFKNISLFSLFHKD